MLIKKIKLNNIRSYLNQEIKFPEGSTLLSGNIGSGKSSILLAVDFALFGLRKGELSGSALLRNGANLGSVELNFQLENDNVIIKRTLKREANSINQGEGYLMINDRKFELSPVEIKQRILDMFNYPKELLTKSKSLIYKYTIYTPQEEMKQILLGDKDFRLDTIRKVFGIDKYKRINENISIYIKHLKERSKILKAKTEDLYQKINENEQAKIKKEKLQEQLIVLKENIFNLESEVEREKKSLDETELKIKELNELKQKIAVNTTNLAHFSEQEISNDKKIRDLEKEIKESYIHLEDLGIENTRQKILDMESTLNKIEAENRTVLLNMREAEIMIAKSENMKNNINKLDQCPTCKQKVGEEHKCGIIDIEDLQIKKYKNLLEQDSKQKEINDENTLKARREIEELRKTEREQILTKAKIERLNEKKEQLKKLIDEQDNLKIRIEESLAKKSEYYKKLEYYKDIDELFLRFKERIEQRQKELRKLEIEKATFDSEIKNLDLLLERLEKEIREKEEAKLKISELIKLQDFLEINFSSLMQTMEKQIMLRVHQDFNSMFQKWFSILVDNEQLQIKLDYEFTPQIIQNGHDIEYINLSGGEKTAAALAYRLALNQTINKLMSKIKTKDLIILDEPTDGFSSEQLDRIRLVLDELEVKQLIIVSHEAKIESFVDNIIRLNKQEHITSVL